MATCQEYREGEKGLVPCRCKALRFIIFRDSGDCISGCFCASHAIALRRKETRGAIEILADEPIEKVEEEIPSQGEPMANPERTYVEIIGLGSR